MVGQLTATVRDPASRTALLLHKFFINYILQNSYSNETPQLYLYCNTEPYCDESLCPLQLEALCCRRARRGAHKRVEGGNAVNPAARRRLAPRDAPRLGLSLLVELGLVCSADGGEVVLLTDLRVAQLGHAQARHVVAGRARAMQRRPEERGEENEVRPCTQCVRELEIVERVPEHGIRRPPAVDEDEPPEDDEKESENPEVDEEEGG